MTTNIEEAIERLTGDIAALHDKDCLFQITGEARIYLANDIQLLINTVNREKWMSILDELPENKQFIMFHKSNGDILTGRYYKDHNSWGGVIQKVADVTHWKPINPPKEYE